MAASAPEGMSTPGAALWDSIAGNYVLRADELATLEDACSLTDMIAALSAAWAEDGKPLTTKGSMGQQVTHPMISEIRTHRMARAALLRSLKLPDAPAEGGAGETNQNRSAAQSRWAQAHGAGA